MDLAEITYMKVKCITRKLPRIMRLCFLYRQKQNEKNSRRNHGKSMLNQSKEVLYICVSFQESQDSIEEKPETNVYDIFLSYWRRF